MRILLRQNTSSVDGCGGCRDVRAVGEDKRYFASRRLQCGISRSVLSGGDGAKRTVASRQLLPTSATEGMLDLSWRSR